MEEPRHRQSLAKLARFGKKPNSFFVVVKVFQLYQSEFKTGLAVFRHFLDLLPA